MTMFARQEPRARWPIITVLLAGAMLAATACTPRVQQTGNLPDPTVVSGIQTGIHTRRDVADLLGTPSTISTFQDRVWYYISQRQEATAFFKPEITDQQVLEIKFDEQGVVQETQLYSLDDAEQIDPVSRETPTEGNELTILQQLIGNIGRFSSTATTNDQ